MALTGKLLADFTEFYNACTEARAALQGMEAGGTQAQTTLDKMAASLSDRRLVEDANAAAAAVGQIGGASSAGAPPINSLQEALGKFDSTLQALGISIGPQIKSIQEISSASGESAASLGILSTAGLAVGAGMAGWKVGRAAADFFDLDEQIGNATAKLLGFGDVASAVAGAKADALATASARVGFAVTEYSTALQINADWQGKWRSNTDISAAATANWHREIEQVRSSGDLPQLTADLSSQNFSLQSLADRYHVSVAAIQAFTHETKAAAEAEKAAGDVITASNAKKIKAITEELSAREAVRALAAKTTLELTKLDEQYNQTRVQHGGTANDAAIAQIEAWEQITEAQYRKVGIVSEEVYAQLHANADQLRQGVGADWDFINSHSQDAMWEMVANAEKTLDVMLTGSQEFNRNVIDAQRDKVDQLRESARGMGDDYQDSFERAAAAAEIVSAKLKQIAADAKAAAEKVRAMGGSMTYDLSTDAGMAKFKQLNPGAAINVGKEYFDKHTLEDAVRAGLIDLYAGFRKSPGFAFASGVTDFQGGLALVGERGPELVNLPKGSDVIPAGRFGQGSGVTVQNTFNIVDTEANIARRVSDTIMRSVMQGRVLSTS